MYKHLNNWVNARVIFPINIILLTPSAVLADTENNIYTSLQIFGDLLLPKVSQVTVGGGVAYTPDYFGSDDYQIRPRLAFYVKIDDYVSLGAEGVSFNVFGLRNFQFGPVFNITANRSESSNTALKGLGDVKASVDVGIFAKALLFERYSIRMRFFDDLLGGNNGSFADLTLGAVLHKKDNFSVAMGLKGSWTESKRAGTFFGVTPDQSMSSGLPIYNPGNSLSDVQSDISARWEFGENLALNGYVRYARILGANSNSPIVAIFGTPDQFTVGTFLTYTFNL